MDFFVEKWYTIYIIYNWEVFIMLPDELKNKLCAEYKYRIEMHAHTTPESTCSHIPPAHMARIYHELGYDAVVITNHFIYDYNFYEKLPPEQALEKYMLGYENTKKEAAKYGMNVILGAELRFTENINDYLIYGINKEMLAEIYELLPFGLKSFRQKFNMDKSILFQAHPFRDGMETVNPKLLDGMETFNMHLGHNSRVAQAVQYVHDNGIAREIAGSDFHEYGRAGAAAIRTKVMPEDSFELAKLLKTGDYLIEIGGNSIVLP